jgi:transcriptional regulator with XRE-family HTH domain
MIAAAPEGLMEYTRPGAVVPEEIRDIPARMKAARRVAGLTQVELATRLQVSAQIVRAWEQAVNTPHGLYARVLLGWLREVEAIHPWSPRPPEPEPEDPSRPPRCPAGHEGRMAFQGERYRCRECDKISKRERRAAARGGRSV